MSIVVDASVAVKWFSEEVRSAQAEAILIAAEPIVAPDLILAEIGSALARKTTANILLKAQAVAAITEAPHCFEQLVPSIELAARATELAIELRHPIYDCFYLALAEREKLELVTDDKKLRSVAKKAKVKAREM
jgi:predicted nucleic acid-binding protein